MKKLLLSTLIAAAALCPALAQRSYFGKAEVGFGRQSVRAAGWKPGPAAQAVLSGGVVVKKLTVEIGFGVARSTTSANPSETFIECGTGLTPDFFYPRTMRYTRLVMPLTLGYSLPLSQRLSLQPRLGLQGAYWTNAYYVATPTDATEQPITGVLRRSMPAVSLSAQGGVHLQYRAAPRVGVFGGPTYRYGLTPETGFQQRSRGTSIDAGVQVYLDAPSRAAVKRP